MMLKNFYSHCNVTYIKKRLKKMAYAKEIVEGTIIFYAQFLYGLLTIVTIGISLFLTFRWGATILWAQDETRRRLLGPVFFDLFADSDFFLLGMVSLYLGFKFTQSLVSLAKWRRYMEFENFRLIRYWKDKRRILKIKRAKMARIQEQEEVSN